MSALWPTGSTVQPKIIRWYGRQFDPFTKVTSLHAGVDIAASAGLYEGTPLHAAETGTVIYSGISGSLTSGYGNLIVIRTPADDYYLYGHLQTGTLHPRGPIGQGDIVGHCGHTGGATGPHSHFGTGHGGWFYDHLSDPTVFMLAKNGTATATASLNITPIAQEDIMPNAIVCEEQGSTDFANIAVVTGNGELHIVTPKDRPWWDNLAACYNPKLSAVSVSQIQYQTFVAANQPPASAGFPPIDYAAIATAVNNDAAHRLAQ